MCQINKNICIKFIHSLVYNRIKKSLNKIVQIKKLHKIYRMETKIKSLKTYKKICNINVI